ncbi:DsbC family protein [Hydrogenivirga sp.]
MRKAFLTFLVSSVLIYSCQAGQAKSCPDESTVKTNLSKLVNREFKIVSLKPVEGFNGLCEVVLKMGLKPIVIYTNAEGKNYIVGNIFNVETKENYTQKTASKYMSVSKDVLDKLEKHVNMTYGKGDKYVYYITDPDCPFCRRFSPMLKDWAKKNNVQVKVILYPLPIHPEAKSKAVAMVCDKKGYDDIHKNVNTKNQCKKGKEAIEKNLKLLQDLGISGTPTVIGMNGKYIVGLPRSAGELNNLIK